MMRHILLATAFAGGICAATAATAQVRNENPMGLDYGSFHPAVPSQVTTYYPPEPWAAGPRRHHRVRRPSY